jgi:glycosyltransferase involved in cell wall biosynthesis
MKGKPEKTVALIDPVWVGHHPMYFTQFTGSFLRAGARVIGLCPDPQGALANLRAAFPDADLDGRVRMFNLRTGKRSFFNGRFEGDPARTFDRWRKAADALADAQSASGWQADLMYFPYLDSYLRFMPLPILPEMLIHLPWSGLYLRNHHHGEKPSFAKRLRLLAKGDAIFRSRTCLEVGVLDERFIPAMEQLTGKRVIAYPDVTQEGMPPAPTALAEEIRNRAAGRPVIGIIGLEKRKGFLTLLRTAKLAKEREIPAFFVCAGIYPPGEYTEEERSEISALTEDVSDILHFNPDSGRIASEADYNSLFSVFDIAWAAYEDFQGSSGTLSKAALFGKTCIATAGECVGQRVERYRMGMTIKQGSAEAALEAIRQLAVAKLEPRFADYREDHSLARLDSILANLLERV